MILSTFQKKNRRFARLSAQPMLRPACYPLSPQAFRVEKHGGGGLGYGDLGSCQKKGAKMHLISIRFPFRFLGVTRVQPWFEVQLPLDPPPCAVQFPSEWKQPMALVPQTLPHQSSPSPVSCFSFTTFGNDFNDFLTSIWGPFQQLLKSPSFFGICM